jgi:hypothetical protein
METCVEVAYDEALWAWVDTCKDCKKEVLDRDYACSAYPACYYLIWGSLVCRLCKLLSLFIFDRIYSFTSLFLYHVEYRYDSFYLIYELIYDFSSLLR